MAISFPYIQYGFIEGNRRRVCVDFLIYGMSKKDYCLKVINGGKALQLGMVVPSFFTDPNRLQIANEDDTGFNTRTHKATAFQEVVSKLNDALDNEEPLLADPMKVSLLYPCEDEFEWEVLGFENEDLERNDDMEQQQQHFFILSVDLISTTGNRRRKVASVCWDRQTSKSTRMGMVKSATKESSWKMTSNRKNEAMHASSIECKETVYEGSIFADPFGSHATGRWNHF